MARLSTSKGHNLATHPSWRVGLALYEPIALTALLLICGVLLLFFATLPNRQLVSIAAGQVATDQVFSAGFNGTERHPDGYGYLWTTDSALVQLRGAYYAAPRYLVDVRLRSANPDGAPPLTFLAGGEPIAVVVPDDRFRTYKLLLDAASAYADAELWFGLQTQPFTPPDDTRTLGVMLTDLTITPLADSQRLTLIALTVSLGGLWTLLRLLQRPGSHALAMTGLAGLGLVTLSALYRPAALPFSWLAALALVGVLLAALAARPLAARLGLSALALLITMAVLIWPAWLSDDAFISFRYAQNLVQGHGLVYNPGERVEGYTNFLWTIMAAVVLRLGGDLVLWSHAAGVLLGLLIATGTYVVATRLIGAAWALVAALIVATSQSLLLYTARGSGLETGLFALLVLAGGGCYLAALRAAPAPGAFGLAGLLFALAALTRPEGVLVLGLTGLHLLCWLLWQRSPASEAAAGTAQPADPDQRLAASGYRLAPLWALAGAFFLVYLPYFAWRFSYYGDLLPNTFYAKTGGGLHQVQRGLTYAGGFALTLGGPLLLVIVAPWLRGWRAALGSWRGYVLPLTLVYSAYIIAVGGDHFRGERFFVPLIPWLAILLADGLATLLTAPHAAQRLVRPLLALGLATGALAALARTAPLDTTIRGLDESVWIWREIGWWMADHTPPEASIAVAGAGAIAFYGQRTTIDMYGLTDRHIGRLAVADMGQGVAGHEKGDPAYILDQRRPDYIPRIWEAYFGGATTLEPRYRLISVPSRSGRSLELWERRP